jgi:hypothetical protein
VNSRRIHRKKCGEYAARPLKALRTLVLNRVLDGMEGKLTNARWTAIGKCSADTPLRYINDLLARGVLGRLEVGGAEHGVCFAQIGLWPSWRIRIRLSNQKQLCLASRPETQGFVIETPPKSRRALLCLSRGDGARQLRKLGRHRGVAGCELLDRQIVGLVVGQPQIVRSLVQRFLGFFPGL